jgi:thioredoxin-like negative regulator of GroEL
MSVIELTKDNFQETIDGEGIVLVDFWATWWPVSSVCAGVREGLGRAR